MPPTASPSPLGLAAAFGFVSKSLINAYKTEQMSSNVSVVYISQWMVGPERSLLENLTYQPEEHCFIVKTQLKVLKETKHLQSKKFKQVHKLTDYNSA